MATFFDYSPDGGGTWYPATPASSSPAPITQTSPSGEAGTFIWNVGADDAVGDEVLFRVRVVPSAPIAPAQRGIVAGISPPFRIKALDCYWPVGAKIQGAPQHVAVDEELTLQAYLESASGAIHYLWDFGDGELGSGIEITHLYHHNGVFTVTLTVEGNACPVARPAYARAVIAVGTGIPDRIIYLPLLLRQYGGGGTTASPVRMSRSQTTVLRPSRSRLPQAVEQAAAQQVTNFSQGVNSQPAISGDGSRVVFWSTWPGDGNSDGSIEIVLADIHPDRSVDYAAVTSSTGSILGGFNLYPAIDEKGERITFFSDRNLTGENEDHNFEVFLADVDSRRNVTLTQVTKTSRGLNVLPDISGDGRYLAFISNQNLTGENANKKTEVFLAEIGAGGAITLSQITHSTDEENDQPAINYNGQYIAFVTTRDGARDLRLAEVGSGGAVTLTTITADGSINERPAISDDGTRIVFISNRTGVRQVFLAERNNQGGFDISQITTDGSDKNQPTISADGKRVAYIAAAGRGKRQLHLYDLVDKDEVNTRAGDRAAYPAFDADGTTVAFISGGNVLLREYSLADLAIGKTADKTVVQPGDHLKYTLQVINYGPSKAHGVTVTDPLPDGVVAGLPMTMTDYTDDDGDLAGFGGGTQYGTTWDGGNGWLTMNTSDNLFALPDNGGNSDAWLNMSGNVLLLHLDEPLGSATFSDTSSMRNNGTCTSPYCPQANGGKLGGGMKFDGNNDYITVNGNSSLELSNFTIGFWVRPTGTSSAYQLLVDKENSAWREYGLFIKPNSMQVNYSVNVKESTGSCVSFGATSKGQLILNQWNHVVLTYDGIVFRLYLNGHFDDLSTPWDKALCTGDGSLLIGGGLYDSLKGRMDEVFIFNRALDSREVAAIYQRQSPIYGASFESRVMKKTDGVGAWSLLSWLPYRPTGKALPDYGGVEAEYPADGLDMSGNVLLWHLDENGSPFQDTSGKGNDGTCPDDSHCPQARSDGRLANAVRFDGDDDYIIANPVEEFPANEITAMFWVRDEDLDKEESYISYATVAHANEFWIFGKADYGGNIAVIIGNGGRSGDTGVNVADGAWHHVAVTWRSFDGRLEIYKDGQPADTRTLRQGYSLIGGGAVVLGQDQDRVGGGFDSAQALKGSLDEVAIFNRVLSADEIQAAYLRGALQMQFQVRTCYKMECPSRAFQGPYGDRATYYSDKSGNDLTPPAQAIGQTDRTYIQYRVYLGTYDTNYLPALQEARIWPDVQCAGVSTVTCKLTPLAPNAPAMAIDLPVTVTEAAYDLATPSGGQRYLVNVAEVDAEESDHAVKYNTASCQTRVSPIPPTAVALAGPTAGVVGTVYTFTATITPSNASKPFTYTWQATDQTAQQHVDGLSDTGAYAWSVPGAKTVVVYAVNDAGVVVSDTRTIRVTDVPIAGLTALNDGPTVLGQPTTLTATVTAGSNVIYRWALGDGDSGFGAVVTHTYGMTGTYTAVVTASNSVSVMTATTTVTLVSPTHQAAGGMFDSDTKQSLGGEARFPPRLCSLHVSCSIGGLTYDAPSPESTDAIVFQRIFRSRARLRFSTYSMSYLAM